MRETANSSERSRHGIYDGNEKNIKFFVSTQHKAILRIRKEYLKSTHRDRMNPNMFRKTRNPFRNENLNFAWPHQTGARANL